jgi:ribosome-binding factor A
MAREFGRPQRIADFLKRELAQLIQYNLRDPRIGMVSVNDVVVSRDLSHAKVYVTFLGVDGADEAAEPLSVLNKASGFLRSKIAANVTMRITPRLHFCFDSSIERGRHLSSLIESAVKADQQFHQDDDKSAINGVGGDSDSTTDVPVKE